MLSTFYLIDKICKAQCGSVEKKKLIQVLKVVDGGDLL